MNEDVGRRMLVAISISVMFLLFLAGIAFAFPFVEIRNVDISIEVPFSLERQIGRFVGKGAASSIVSSLKGSIADTPYLESVGYTYSSHDLFVDLTMKKDCLLLGDGTSFLLVDDGKAHQVDPADMSVLRKHYPLLAVSGEQLRYISRFGIENQFGQVLALLLDLYEQIGYNCRLIGYATYISGTGDGFGELKLYIPSSNAVLTVGEAVDAVNLARSIGIISDDSVVLPAGKEREYELKGNVLVERKRIVDGD